MEAADLQRPPRDQQRPPAIGEVVGQHLHVERVRHEALAEQKPVRKAHDGRLIPEQERHRRDGEPGDQHLLHDVPAKLRHR
jgi:hypothetical protein